MLILSIDSAGSGCSACVWRDGQILGFAEERMERGQDQRLIPLINQVMEQAGSDFFQLDRIGVTRGPGSFTGLRIGLAAARGIGLAAGKPVIGIERFAIYRTNIQVPNKNLLVVINSRREELYCRFYPCQGTTMDTFMMPADDIAAYALRNGDTIVTGDIGVPNTFFHPIDTKEVALCAALTAAADPKNELFLPRPLYIRPPDVTFATNA